MKKLLPLFVLLFTNPVFASSEEIVTFNANKACAEIVGIPYASDNFSDDEWIKFKKCLGVFHYFDIKYPQ